MLNRRCRTDVAPLLIVSPGLSVLQRMGEVEILASLDLLRVRARSRSPADGAAETLEVPLFLSLDQACVGVGQGYNPSRS